jgi:hypothetical protein
VARKKEASAHFDYGVRMMHAAALSEIRDRLTEDEALAQASPKSLFHVQRARRMRLCLQFVEGVEVANG